MKIPEELASITLLEIVDRLPASVRLTNCLYRAYEEGAMPYQTIGDYLSAGDYALYKIKIIPNLGSKSAEELDELVHEVIEKGGIYSGDDIEVRGSIDENLMSLPFIQVMNLDYVSARLINSMMAAKKNGTLPFETLGDYVRAGKSAVYKMMAISNIGKKTALELDDLINSIVSKSGQKLYNEKILDNDKKHTKVMSSSLIDFVDSQLGSTRLTKGLHKAERFGWLPFKTVADYIEAGPKAKSILLNLPNLGKKSVTELDAIIKNVISEDKLQEIVSNNSNEEINYHENDTDVVEILFDRFKDILNAREYDVLHRRSVEKETLETVGLRYNVTRERVRQIEVTAIQKIKRCFRLGINSVARLIDNELDNNYDDISISDLSEVFGVNENLIYFLFYVIQKELKEKTAIKEGHIYRVKINLSYIDWNEQIDEVIMNLSWPVSISMLKNCIDDIPISYISNYLTSKYKAVIENEIVTSLKLSRTNYVTFALRSIGRPARPSEVAAECRKLFSLEISEHNAGSTLGRMENALIVDRGVYALYEMLSYTSNDLDNIREICYRYIKDANQYIGVKVLYAELFKNNSDFPDINDYTILGILQDDKRFETAPGLMVGLINYSREIHIKPLTETVLELVYKEGPLRVRDIKERISETRRVLDVGITVILENSPDIIKIEPGLFDTIEHVFGNQNKYNDYLLAIKLILIDKVSTILSIQKRLDFLTNFNELNINKITLHSILKKCNDIDDLDGRYSLLSVDEEIRKYNEIVSSLIERGIKSEKIRNMVSNELGSDYSKKFCDLDFRLSHKYEYADSQKEKDTEVSKILASFGI